MTKYKFRSECLLDIEELMILLKKEDINAESIVKTSEIIPDCVCVICTSLSILELKDIIENVADGHVMLETLARLEEYTGERL